jgi:hypothetical protein
VLINIDNGLLGSRFKIFLYLVWVLKEKQPYKAAHAVLCLCDCVSLQIHRKQSEICEFLSNINITRCRPKVRFLNPHI